MPELMPILGSQSAGDVSHKPGGSLPLLSARPALTPATLKRAATSFAARIENLQIRLGHSNMFESIIVDFAITTAGTFSRANVTNTAHCTAQSPSARPVLTE